MSDLTFQDILDILRLIDSGSFAHFQIEFEGTKLKVSRRAGISSAGDRQEMSRLSTVEQRAVSPTAAVTQKFDNISLVDDQRVLMTNLPASQSTLESGNSVDVKSPMAGTFYCAQSPGATPFVAVGRTVAKGDKLGIVEVMKLFTAVLSPCDGIVRAILVENEELVQSDQTLMTIDATEQGEAIAADNSDATMNGDH